MNPMRTNKALKLAAFALLFTCSMPAVFGQVYYKSGTFKLEKASKFTLYPGVEGSPVTTTVSFMLIMKTCSRLTLDSFWMDGYTDKVNIRYKSGEVWDGKPMKGDTLLVALEYFRVTTPIPSDVDDEPFLGSRQANAPVSHKGQALFRYKLGDKSYYYSFKDIVVRESVYAP